MVSVLAPPRQSAIAAPDADRPVHRSSPDLGRIDLAPGLGKDDVAAGGGGVLDHQVDGTDAADGMVRAGRGIAADTDTNGTMPLDQGNGRIVDDEPSALARRKAQRSEARGAVVHGQHGGIANHRDADVCGGNLRPSDEIEGQA